MTPRGSGTGLSGGAVPVYGGIMLLTTAMNRILEIEEDDLSVTRSQGLLLQTFTRRSRPRVSSIHLTRAA